MVSEPSVRVREVMRERFESLTPSSTVLEAADLMLLSGQEAIPVMQDGHLVGMIAERDIFAHLLRTLSEGLYELGILSVNVLDPSLFETIAAIQVEGLMSRRIITTSPDTHAIRAAATMQARRIRRLPVLDHGSVVGVVFQEDILRALVHDIPLATRRRLRQS